MDSRTASYTEWASLARYGRSVVTPSVNRPPFLMRLLAAVICIVPSHSQNTMSPVREIYYPVWYLPSFCAFDLQHPDCLKGTSLNTYAAVLAEARNDVGQIVRGLLPPKMKGRFNSDSAASPTAFLGVTFSVVHRNLQFRLQHFRLPARQMISPEAESSLVILTPLAIAFRTSLDRGHGKAISMFHV